jgi:hypothetical protein
MREASGNKPPELALEPRGEDVGLGNAEGLTVSNSVDVSQVKESTLLVLIKGTLPPL